IQWDLAKKALADGDEATSKRQAARAAGNFYNAFLNYEGSEYANRSALMFEDLKVWVKESFGTELKMGDASPRLAELMFKRQLDLARNLLQNGNAETAETRLLEAFGTYPDTQYTLVALDTLSHIWIEQDQEWELMALAGHISDQFPDQDDAARIMLRVGRKMAADENLFGVEQVLGAFGRNYPSHPNAPGMLYRIGKAAAERGENGLAHEVYEDVLNLYPNSNFAVSVLQTRGDVALAAENYEEAVKSYERVRDQARNPLQAAFARLRITDIKLTSGDVELEKEAVEELRTLREELSQTDSEFYEEGNREQTLTFLQNVRYRIGQVLLRKAGREDDAELRAQAANELNSFLQDYPNTDQAPDVMYNLGRLYLQQGQFDQATQTFDRLANRYPTSEAGKDALYSLVRAALEENQVEVAQDAVRRMVAQPEAYEIEKIYQVAQLMLDNKRWQEAKSSFELVLASERTRDDDTMRQRALYGMGKAAVGAEEYEAAVESLQTLITDFSTSALVVDAGISLSEAYLRMKPPQPEKAREALGAVSRILRSRPDKADRARRDIALGHVSMAEGESGAALANWYGVGLTKPDSEELGALVREAIELALAVAQEEVREGNLNRWNLIVELTDQYLRNFPLDKKAEEMRSLNVRAIGMAPEE
nr:outer membrane protein assembly factor BamD [Kiritimatiellia bacterium]